MLSYQPLLFGRERSAGVLCHPTALPGTYGIGTLGEHARTFIDFLAECGFRWWQVLPLHPPAVGNSPYSAFSAFAGNPLLLDLDQLVAEGDLHAISVPRDSNSNHQTTDQAEWKRTVLHNAAQQFFKEASPERMKQFWDFCDDTFWLHDYAVFTALHHHFKDVSWHQWPQEIRERQERPLRNLEELLGGAIGTEKYIQWQFDRQWKAVRQYAAYRGIGIIGDVPIFVADDSADVWCNQELFLLDPAGNSTVVAGVPPDAFSETGQFWGNPLYDWQKMADQGYRWWVERIRQVLRWYDVVRLDHFRGFEAAWHIPVTAASAQEGTWQAGPGAALFDTLHFVFGTLPFIAEDLGVITPAVEELRDRFALPGMVIIQFAFDSDSSNPYLPHNHQHNAVAYSGTHDNDTLVGWLDSLTERQQQAIKRYLGTTDTVTPDMILRLVWSSVAQTAIVPLTDLLCLGSEARFNRPGVAEGNWEWQAPKNYLDTLSRLSIRTELETYGRITPQDQ